LVQNKAIYLRVVSTDISAYYCLFQEIYDKQKELILLGERVVLVTLGFDLNIHHAYRPLVEAIRRFNIDNKSPLAQVAWNFVNDGYANATLAVFFEIAVHSCVSTTLNVVHCTGCVLRFACSSSLIILQLVLSVWLLNF